MHKVSSSVAGRPRRATRRVQGTGQPRRGRDSAAAGPRPSRLIGITGVAPDNGGRALYVCYVTAVEAGKGVIC